MATLVQQPTKQIQTLDPATKGLFTCLSCQVAFNTTEAQRAHYQTDWHRYNLKRKVAELPPVSSDLFNEKVTAQRTKDAEAAYFSTSECLVCEKVYSTENAYNNHVQSKKHKEAVARFDNDSLKAQHNLSDSKEGRAVESTVVRHRERPIVFTEDMTEDEVNDAIDRKIEVAILLDPEDCLFCSTRSDSFELNMEHMTQIHSLFVPDIEYLEDLPGLIKHLGEKISVANVCLLCNDRGRAFKSMEAVRGHMDAKSHCKIAYDTDEDRLEIAEFYDFSNSYSDTDGIDDDVEMGDAKVEGRISAGEVETELVLPSGARVGHRSMRRYYRQHLREEQSRDSVIINRLITHYDTNQIARVGGGKTALVKSMEQSGNVGKAAQIRADQRAQRSKNIDFATRVGYKMNSQKHFRDELLQ